MPLLPPPLPSFESTAVHHCICQQTQQRTPSRPFPLGSLCARPRLQGAMSWTLSASLQPHSEGSDRKLRSVATPLPRRCCCGVVAERFIHHTNRHIRLCARPRRPTSGRYVKVPMDTVVEKLRAIEEQKQRGATTALCASNVGGLLLAPAAVPQERAPWPPCTRVAEAALRVASSRISGRCSHRRRRLTETQLRTLAGTK
jgi:hypothetical protein